MCDYVVARAAMLDKKIADPETEPEKKKMHTKAKDAVVSALETLGDSTDRSALVALCNAAKDPLPAGAPRSWHTPHAVLLGLQVRRVSVATRRLFRGRA